MKDWLISLEPLRPLLESYTPPEVEADSQNNRTTYDMLSLSIKAHKVGTLAFEVQGEEIKVHLDRPGEDGYRSYAKLNYTMDRNPNLIRKWDARVWMAKADSPEKPYAYTEMITTGEVRNGQAILRCGSERRVLDTHGPLAGKWTLLETARRMAPIDRAESQAFSFTMLDEYRILHSGQELQVGDWMETPGGFTMKPILHTGTGQIPRVFWVDQSGRLIAYQSGTEAAVLTQLNGAEANYSKIRYDLRKMKLSPELQP